MSSQHQTIKYSPHVNYIYADFPSSVQVLIWLLTFCHEIPAVCHHSHMLCPPSMQALEVHQESQGTKVCQAHLAHLDLQDLQRQPAPAFLNQTTVRP